MDPRNGGHSIHLACKDQISYRAGRDRGKGNQQAARQCLLAAVNRKNEQAEQKESVVETPSQQLQNPREGVRAGYAE